MHQVDVVQGVVHHAFQQRLGHVGRQIGIDRAIIARVLESVVGQAQHADIGHTQFLVVLSHNLF